MENWYYKLKGFGEEIGPVPFSELVECAKRHTLGCDDEVRFGDTGAWRRAGSMGTLMAHMPSGAHLPAVAVASTSGLSSNESDVRSSAQDFEPGSYENSAEEKAAWHYKIRGDEFGPVTLDGLIDLAKSRELSSDDEVRFGVSGNWRRAGSMGKLMAHMPSGAFQPSAASTASVDSLSEMMDLEDSSSEIPTDEKVGWYYKVFGDQFGPLSIEELIELAKNHSLNYDDEVRFGANGAWRRAGSIGQLMAHLPFQAAAPITFDLAKSRAAKDRAAATENSSTSAVATAAVDSDEDSEEEDAIIWWCTIQSKEYGPVDLAKIMRWVARGRVRREDHIRCGQNAYVLAGELPGLFPDLPSALPTAPAASETKSELAAMSDTRSMATAAPAAERPRSAEMLATSTPNADQRSESPSSAAAAMSSPRPMYSPPSGMGGGRPVVPMRRPPAKSSSGGLGKFLIPGLGVVGVVLLGALLYFVLPILLHSDAANIKRLTELQVVYKDIQATRKKANVKKEDFKPITDKIVAAAKPVEDELKGKTSDIQKSLLSLSRVLQKIAKEPDLTKASNSEKSADKLIADLKKRLGQK